MHSKINCANAQLMSAQSSGEVARLFFQSTENLSATIKGMPMHESEALSVKKCRHHGNSKLNFCIHFTWCRLIVTTSEVKLFIAYKLCKVPAQWRSQLKRILKYAVLSAFLSNKQTLTLRNLCSKLYLHFPYFTYLKFRNLRFFKFLPKFQVRFMHAFLVIFWCFITLSHLNDRFKRSLNLEYN